MFRKLETKDLPAVTELVKLQMIHHPDLKGFYWTDEDLIKEFAEGVLGWGSFSVSHQLQGFILYRQNFDIGEILLLATDPKLKRSGIMRDLLATFEKSTPELNEFWLEVHQENLPAQNFYEKAQFEAVGTRPYYYRDGGAALLYTKKKK
jgi:ribosomal protein S18 acetylase RimI-like enzyme